MGDEVMSGKELHLKMASVSDVKTAHDFIKKHEIPSTCHVIDITSSALKEYYEIKHPERKDAFVDTEYQEFLTSNGIDMANYGNWVYYPWRNTLLKVPPREHLQLLRTARNQLLITPEEQQKLLSASVLVAGMSVGSNVVEQMIHCGIGGTFIIADMDVIEITNLNRIKTGLLSVGVSKVLDVAHKVLELDPYLSVVMYENGVSDENLAEIFSAFEVNVIVDEVDDIKAKIDLRNHAKRLRTPLLMATDNSDGALIDIERYDSDPNQDLFHGKIPKEILDKMSTGELTREEAGNAIGQYFVGIDLVDNKLITSLMQVRRTIPSWPQLGTAASASGILVAYCAKLLLTGQEIDVSRYVLQYDKDINASFKKPEYSTERDKLLKLLMGQG